MAPRSHNLRYPAALLVLAIGGALTWGGFQLARRVEQDEDRAALHAQAGELARDLDRELADTLKALETVGDLVAVQDKLDRDRFHDLTAPFLRRHPSIETLEWVVRVSAEQRPAFEAACVAEGLPGYSIWTRRGGERADRQHPYYYPVLYVEPRERYAEEAGYDRRDYRAMLIARRTGLPAASRIHAIKLHGFGGPDGFAVFFPVYQDRRPAATSQELEATWRGSLCATVHAAELVRQASLRSATGQGLWLRIVDITSTGEPREVFQGESDPPGRSAPSITAPAEVDDRLSAGHTVRFADRAWRLSVAPTADYPRPTPWRSAAALLGGLLVSAALAVWWLSAANRSYRTEQLVAQRTEELSSANRALADEIGQRIEAQRELRDEQVYLKHLLGSHERDRQLMAFEIHDGMVQYSIAALMYLEGFVSGQPAGAQTSAKVEKAIQLVRSSIAEARRLMNGLRPPVLDDLGVVAAIQSLIDEQPSAQERIRFIHQVNFGRLNPLLEGTIYRIVQESLANIQRHSQATQAQVSLVQRGERLELEVRDWGVGFDTLRLDGRGFGLRGLAERARLFDADLKIESQPDQGARVFVEFPVISAVSAERTAGHVGSGSV